MSAQLMWGVVARHDDGLTTHTTIEFTLRNRICHNITPQQGLQT